MGANRTTYPLHVVKTDMQLLTATLTGGGAAADLINSEAADMGGGEVATAKYQSTGVFAITFRKLYPHLKAALVPAVDGTTAYLRGKLSAVKVDLGTATLTLDVDGVLTDPATTDIIHLVWIVRNSGFNK